MRSYRWNELGHSMTITLQETPSEWPWLGDIGIGVSRLLLGVSVQERDRIMP